MIKFTCTFHLKSPCDLFHQVYLASHVPPCFGSLVPWALPLHWVKCEVDSPADLTVFQIMFHFWKLLTSRGHSDSTISVGHDGKKNPTTNNHPIHAEMSAKTTAFEKKYHGGFIVFFGTWISPGVVDSPQHKRIKNWANSNRKFFHTLHQTIWGGFACSNMRKFASTTSTWNTIKKLIVLDPRLLFRRKNNDQFFFVGLVGEIQIANHLPKDFRNKKFLKNKNRWFQECSKRTFREMSCFLFPLFGWLWLWSPTVSSVSVPPVERASPREVSQMLHGTGILTCTINLNPM